MKWNLLVSLYVLNSLRILVLVRDLTFYFNIRSFSELWIWWIYLWSHFFIWFSRSNYKRFGFTDVFQKSVLYPFLVILVLMFLLQFSGQGVVTFYTAEIFKDAESAVDPNDCALVIGVTYFLSSILGLVLKKHVGRRFLLLASEFGMAISQLAMGIYFYVLTSSKKFRCFFDNDNFFISQNFWLLLTTHIFMM